MEARFIDFRQINKDSFDIIIKKILATYLYLGNWKVLIN